MGERGATSIGAAMLGNPRAEADELLHPAFVEKEEYRAVTQTAQYAFVVGRRGTGKSALFIRAADYFRSRPNAVLTIESPPEHLTLEFNGALERLPSYVLQRAAARLCWRGHLLLRLVDVLSEPNAHQDLKGTGEELRVYKQLHRTHFEGRANGRFLQLLNSALNRPVTASTEIPRIIADSLRLEDLERTVGEALEEAQKDAIFLLDGLDEGWEPTQAAAANLSGLAHALTHFVEARVRARGIAFVRDSMFRNLSARDTDYSRLIEGATLQMAWDGHSLLHLVANRLRLSLRLESVQNHLRVWDQFVSTDLRGQSGFDSCLKHTLMRPRDILLLLNRAAYFAARGGRAVLMGLDVERAGVDISESRLNDLIREYEPILPGLRLVIHQFSGKPALQRVGSLVRLLDSELEGVASDSRDGEKKSVWFSSGAEAVKSLFAIGFVGARTGPERDFRFSHDGSDSTLDPADTNAEALVHPCFWQAVGAVRPGLSDEVLAEVVDEEASVQPAAVRDVRLRKIGELVQELAPIPLGRDGALKFEAWSKKILQILFPIDLTHFELKPSPGAVNQRDLIATIVAETGFWARINRDYGTRQLVFEIKNFEDPTSDDFRQLLSYTGNEFGRFAVLVVRSENESTTATCKQQIQSLYHEHHRVVLVLQSAMLVRCVEKLRNAERFDYSLDQLDKRLNQLLRSIAPIRAASGRSARRRT